MFKNTMFRNKSAKTSTVIFSAIAFAVCFVLGLLSASTRNGGAQSGCPEWTARFGTYPNGSNVIMITDGLNDTYKQQIDNAASAMNAALASKGIGVGFINPPSSTSTGATVIIEVGPIGATETGSSPVAKIMSTTYNNEGYLETATVRLDPNKQLHNSQGQLINVLSVPSNILKAILHEFGHLVGLGHHPFNHSQVCGGQTTPSIMNAMCSADATNIPTALTDCDKGELHDAFFVYPFASPTPTPELLNEAGHALCGDGGDNDGDIDVDCGDAGCDSACPNGCSQWQWDLCLSMGGAGCVDGNCYTPILIDVLGNGFQLTSAEQGILLEVLPCVPVKLSWTARDSDDAWLALDRNGNGIIDGAWELFGTTTPQPQPPIGISKNGFWALAELDKGEGGGNGDGAINSHDGVFASLLTWQDRNHNGASEPSELQKLSEAKPEFQTASFDLAYKESRRKDEHGNQFLSKAKIRDASGNVIGWLQDVGLKMAATRY